TRTTDDFAVVGCLPPKSGRQPFGALLLAQRAADGWRYLGRVGSGFSTRDFEALRPKLEAALPAPRPAGAEDESRDARWTEPCAVVEVRFKTRSSNGRLRQPVFIALRTDKTPEECRAADDDEPPAPALEEAATVALEEEAAAAIEEAAAAAIEEAAAAALEEA